MNNCSRLSQYETIVFDCDGVILDSNSVKTEAFYQTALPFGRKAADALVAYHVQNGGISRYKKFSHFILELAQQSSREVEVNDLIRIYASYVKDGLIQCQIAPGLKQLRDSLPRSRWLIISGGDQDELRTVFYKREIANWFNGGIFGSPDTKEEIISREIASRNIKKPALFIGDSKYDYQAATSAGLDFLFLSGWTEMKDWKTWTKELNIPVHVDLQSLPI